MNKHKRVFITCLFLAIMASIISHAQDKDIASLMQQLKHTDVDVQDSAFKSLIEMSEAAVPALIEALGDDADREYGAKVSSVLTQIGMPAIPTLIAALDHENAVVRHAVVVKLRYFMSKPSPQHKNIVRALVKAFKDDDYEVRYAAVIHFFGMGESVVELPPELAADVISGLVKSLYYGSPFFCGMYNDVVTILHRMGDRGRAAVTEALHSSSWSLRFGAAVAYGNAFRNIHIRRGMLQHHYIKPLPKAVVSILAEGLIHPDWKTREDAIFVLKKLRLRHCYICDHTDEVHKALDALPPFGIVSQTIRDGDYIYVIAELVEDYSFEDFLDSLNTDGITFKFNRSIRGSGKITIQPVDGEPLGWNVESSSHSITITPPEGKELVRGQRYTIQLRDVKDILGNQVDAEIEFSTEVPLSRRAH